MHCHFLLQEIFPTEGSNLHLLLCRQILYRLSHQGIPKSLRESLLLLLDFTCLLCPRILGLYLKDFFIHVPGYREFRYAVWGFFFILIAITYELLSPLSERNKLGYIIYFQTLTRELTEGLLRVTCNPEQVLFIFFFFK